MFTQEEIEKMKDKVFRLFDSGYEKEYKDIVKGYWKLYGSQAEDFSPQKLHESKEIAIVEILRIKKDKKEKALQIIEDFKSSHRHKLAQKPEPTNTNEKLLQELELSNSLAIVKEEIVATDNGELIELLKQYEEDPLLAEPVDKLIKLELKKRGLKSQLLEIEAMRKGDYGEIELFKNTIKFWLNDKNKNDFFFNIQEDFEKVENRIIENDLNSFPFKNHNTVRFDIFK
ncbi:hypothetical protein [Natronospora cellulosivora (SeqCode)]